MHIRGFHNREVSVIASSGHGCHVDAYIDPVSPSFVITTAIKL